MPRSESPKLACSCLRGFFPLESSQLSQIANLIVFRSVSLRTDGSSREYCSFGRKGVERMDVGGEQEDCFDIPLTEMGRFRSCSALEVVSKSCLLVQFHCWRMLARLNMGELSKHVDSNLPRASRLQFVEQRS